MTTAKFWQKLIVSLAAVLALSISAPREVSALHEDDIRAEAAILMEVSTGRVLFEKNAHQRMYPASMTKLLTAMIAIEYIDSFRAITVGPEIRELPPLSSRAGAGMHEVIRGENLIRLLMIPSGNEIALVIAQFVAEEVEGRVLRTRDEAIPIFAELMNERARELGATNSNFVNPHGFHDPDHYTTPADLAIIARAALDVPMLNRIMRESTFVGNGATQNRAHYWITRNYNVQTHNLLMLEDSDYFYPYATGMKTGFHDQAGFCLAASAERDGFTMVSLVFNSSILGRFRDTIAMFEYGFETYGFKTVQTADTLVGEVEVEDVRHGDPNIVEFRTSTDHIEYLSESEVSRIEHRIEFNRALLYVQEGSEGYLQPTRLTAPIYTGQVLGKIVYTLDGNFLFSDNILATSDIYARDFASDMMFRRDSFISFILSPAAIPIWIALVLVVFGISMLVKRINEQHERSFYKLTKHYGDYKDNGLRW